MTTTELIRAADRHFWRDAAVDSRQSFLATGNFDLAANAFGLLMVHNDDIVAPGEGFDMHHHQDAEIITWVLDGALEHRDSGSAESTIVETGMAQHISAGAGVRHSEVNAAGYTSRQKVRVVQSWLPADVLGTTPSHDHHDYNDTLASGDFVQVAGPSSPLPLGVEGAALWVARLHDDLPRELSGGAFVHFFVATGEAHVDGEHLHAGDTLRLTDAGPLKVTGSGEVLAWVMDRAV
ncbi:pirin family protein [Corynebacterium lubricantis]|uniref:pirin family protein n=1 Tax=Corynebacterium lubricantis TaxID=541095 RepID=UPI000360EC3C|nr:pirin family protein [Corynebacterium lubricantis]